MITRAEYTPEGILFRFRSTWEIPAELVTVWNTVGGVDRWPEWWRSVTAATVVRGPMLPVTVGAVAEYVVVSPLTYTLRFRSEVTAFDLGKWLETRIEGNLAGKGRWDFSYSQGLTAASLTWDVSVTRPALARLAALAPVRRVMSWAHDRVMENGERGLNALVASRRAVREASGETSV